MSIKIIEDNHSDYVYVTLEHAGMRFFLDWNVAEWVQVQLVGDNETGPRTPVLDPQGLVGVDYIPADEGCVYSGQQVPPEFFLKFLKATHYTPECDTRDGSLTELQRALGYDVELEFHTTEVY